MWPGYVESDLLPRLNGFELLMASYTMAHIKIDFALRETGTTPSGKERFRVFLTDSLSDWHKELPGGLFASALAPEQQGADEVKRDTPVMVVMGNPPYSISSQNNNPWIQNLVSDYKQTLDERNIQPLNDDYIKFIRLGQHYVEKNGNIYEHRKIPWNKLITHKDFWKMFCESDFRVFSAVAWNKIYRAKIFKELRYTQGKCMEDNFIISLFYTM